MPTNTTPPHNIPSEDPLVLEHLIQSRQRTASAKEPADTPDLEAAVGAPDPETTFPPPPADKQWGVDNEQEWSEHSTTAWALAYIIHRIRSTPFPPILLPEQRRHFQHVIQMASTLMEEWQQRERDQAQQLAAARPPTGLLAGQPGINQNHSGDENLPGKSPGSTAHNEAEISLAQHLVSDPFCESQEKDTTSQKDQDRDQEIR